MNNRDFYSIRSFVPNDRDYVVAIWKEGKNLLKSLNVPQWQKGIYPSYENFDSDYENKIGYVVLFENRIVGCFSFSDTPELAYSTINGRWLNEDKKYLTLHRVAVKEDMRGKGVMSYILSLCEEKAREVGCGSVRIDTHEKNLLMQRALKKSGYSMVGEIILQHGPEKGDKRLGWEKIVK